MSWQIIQSDVTNPLPLKDNSVQCVVTSPPYWGLRDYGTASWAGGDAGCDHRHQLGGEGTTSAKQNTSAGTQTISYRDQCRKCGATRIDRQLGLEATPELYVERMVVVFREIKRVLRDDGTVWVNLGDSYNSNQGNGFDTNQDGDVNGRKKTAASPKIKWGKPKDLVGIPWRVAFALQADGWYLRSDIIWSKPNPMPESVTDRPTKAHEYIFLLTKSPTYYFDQDAVRENVTGNAHTRGDGVNPKCVMPGQGIKQNNSFSAAVNELVISRNIRTVWEIATQPFSDWTESVHWERVGVCDSYDDKWRIESPDCPRHGGHFDLVANAFCDEHGPWFLIHNFGKRSYPFLAPAIGYAPIDHHLAYWTELQSLGCSVQRCAVSANGHNTESHKKAHALLTNPSCIVCGKTTSHTSGKLVELWRTDSAVRKLLNNISMGDLVAHPLVHKVCGSADISSCCCQYYSRKSSQSSHFATFPTELAERCIKAGTSEKGACSVCGAPYERVVETSNPPERANNRREIAGQSINKMPRNVGDALPQNKTLGWQPTCTHDAPITPCVVLDPFSGAGTTAMVADKLGRFGIGLELKHDYCRMAYKRCYDDAPLLSLID